MVWLFCLSVMFLNASSHPSGSLVVYCFTIRVAWVREELRIACMSFLGALPRCSASRWHPHNSLFRLMPRCSLGSSSPHQGHLIEISPRLVLGPEVTYSMLWSIRNCSQYMLTCPIKNI